MVKNGKEGKDMVMRVKMAKAKGYLLDTDILIAMLRDCGDTTGLRGRALAAGLDNCHVSAISIAELYSGAYKMCSERGLHEVEFIKTIFDIVPFADEDSEIFGRNKTILSKDGHIIGDMDVMIGSTAVARGFTMVTHNKKHFSRIPKLQVEDWLQ